MPFDVIPFSLMPDQRATGTGDARMVNVVSETVKNPLTKSAKFNVIKRPCLANSTQPPAGAATGRGLYAWGATGKIYSVFANKVYSGTTDLGVTLAASSGRVWWTETPETSSARLLIMSDGADNYNITTVDGITQIDEGDDAQYPTSNLGPIVFLKNYLFQFKAGQAVNADLNSFTAWTAGAAFSAGAKGDSVEAGVVLGDQLAIFGKTSVEFTYVSSVSSGSPLLPIDQSRLAFGLAAKETLAWSGDICMFVGENSSGGDGGRSVWLIQKGLIKEVSSSTLNRFLAAEGTSISSASALMERFAGQLCYVLNLSSADRSFVYNLSEGVWDGEWEDANGGNKFNGIAATSLDGTIYVQDAANGRIYTFPTTTFQDSGVTISVTLQTEGRDQGTTNRKIVPFVELVADTQTSGTATLSFSDNDYTTFTTAGTFDLTQENKRIFRCGSYRGKRAWRLVHAQNTAFRAQALRVRYEMGAA